MKNKSKKVRINKIAIIILILIIVLLIILMLIISKKSKNKTVPYEKVQEEFQENNEQADLELLYDMSEQERMSFYCAKFFKMVRINPDKAYGFLNDEYKNNYFPTKENFKKYIEDYFPDDTGLVYKNIERLGDIYVLWLHVTDTVNGEKYGHNFDMYVVIKEKDYNDFEISFSRNSAVDTIKKEE